MSKGQEEDCGENKCRLEQRKISPNKLEFDQIYSQTDQTLNALINRYKNTFKKQQVPNETFHKNQKHQQSQSKIGKQVKSPKGFIQVSSFDRSKVEDLNTDFIQGSRIYFTNVLPHLSAIQKLLHQFKQLHINCLEDLEGVELRQELKINKKQRKQKIIKEINKLIVENQEMVKNLIGMEKEAQKDRQRIIDLELRLDKKQKHWLLVLQTKNGQINQVENQMLSYAKNCQKFQEKINFLAEQLDRYQKKIQDVQQENNILKQTVNKRDQETRERNNYLKEMQNNVREKQSMIKEIQKNSKIIKQIQEILTEKDNELKELGKNIQLKENMIIKLNLELEQKTIEFQKANQNNNQATNKLTVLKNKTLQFEQQFTKRQNQLIQEINSQENFTKILVQTVKEKQLLIEILKKQKDEIIEKNLKENRTQQKKNNQIQRSFEQVMKTSEKQKQMLQKRITKLQQQKNKIKAAFNELNKNINEFNLNQLTNKELNKKSHMNQGLFGQSQISNELRQQQILKQNKQLSEKSQNIQFQKYQDNDRQKVHSDIIVDKDKSQNSKKSQKIQERKSIFKNKNQKNQNQNQKESMKSKSKSKSSKINQTSQQKKQKKEKYQPPIQQQTCIIRNTLKKSTKTMQIIKQSIQQKKIIIQQKTIQIQQLQKTNELLMKEINQLSQNYNAEFNQFKKQIHQLHQINNDIKSKIEFLNQKNQLKDKQRKELLEQLQKITKKLLESQQKSKDLALHGFKNLESLSELFKTYQNNIYNRLTDNNLQENSIQKGYEKIITFLDKQSKNLK